MDIAYETFNGFSKVYGEKYLTSNVQIINPATGEFEYIGNKYRYFRTGHGKNTYIYSLYALWMLSASRSTHHGIWGAFRFHRQLKCL